MARSEKANKNPIADLLQEKRDEILHIAEKHGARNVRVFGSVVHGQTMVLSSFHKASAGKVWKACPV